MARCRWARWGNIRSCAIPRRAIPSAGSCASSRTSRRRRPSMSGGGAEASDVFELSIERLLNAPVEALWMAYTDHLNEWFCPPPWRAEVQAMELRAGGRSSVTMYGPDGEVMPNE